MAGSRRRGDKTSSDAPGTFPVEAEISADPTTIAVAHTALISVSVGAVFSAVGDARSDGVSHRF
jgi:hypothetical protein